VQSGTRFIQSILSERTLMLTPYPEHAAVVPLQHAARSGGRVMIPGALEPSRQRPDAVVAPAEPKLDPVVTDSPNTNEAREGGGTPAGAVTLLDRLQRFGLRPTEAVIRLLATPGRFTIV
jgi:hypothetical protein